MTANTGKYLARKIRLFVTLSLFLVSLLGSHAQAQTSAQDSNIPDAPTVQPSATPEPSPIPKPEEKKPAPALNPWTNQPNQPANSTPASGADPSATPSMPPVTTVPPGSSAKQAKTQEDLGYTIRIHPTFVQLPVSVKDRDGRMVDGLLSSDFVVKENGIPQKLTFFSSDPLALSVAIILDQGMSDSTLQKVNQTFSALLGAFAPYDEVALYSFSSTVSQVSDFNPPTQKLSVIFNQVKTERGSNNGPAVLSGPMANGPIINGVPVGSPTQPVYTPQKQARVLNDAILQAALDLGKRGRTRRKVILIISDGRESGSQAAYKDVLKLLLSREIQVRAIAVGSSALPVYDKIERLHLPKQGYDNLLPKYVGATGGAPVYTELSAHAIEDVYSQAMGEARNQYTLGYVPTRPKIPTAVAYHTVEVLVNRPNLKIYAPDGYYPVIGVH